MPDTGSNLDSWAGTRTGSARTHTVDVDSTVQEGTHEECQSRRGCKHACMQTVQWRVLKLTALSCSHAQSGACMAKPSTLIVYGG